MQSLAGPADILYPLFALAALTFMVLLLIPFARARAARVGEVAATDFRHGESPSVPPRVSLPNRNFMNLLEMPTLFYAVCLMLFVTGGSDATTVTLAWFYVALRAVHSAIHLTYNRVSHRLSAFTLGNIALAALWVIAGLHLAGNAP